MTNLQGWGAGFRLFLLMAFCIVLYVLSVKPAPAQTICRPPSEPYEEVIKPLKEKWGESRLVVLGVGLGRQTIVELWAAPHKNEGSLFANWTLIIRNGNCARQLGAGMFYQILDEGEAVSTPGDDA